MAKNPKNTATTGDDQGTALTAQQTSARDKMLAAVINSKNEDLAFLAKHYGEQDDDRKTFFNNHYQANGTALINAIFNGDVETANGLLDDDDKDLFKGISK